jgi:predicted transcriptional regulator
MAGLSTDHTASGRLTLALRKEGGCTLGEAVQAYGSRATQALEDLEAIGIVEKLPTRPRRWAMDGARLRHTEVRANLIYAVLSRLGPCSTADIMACVPDTRHRIEQALVTLRAAGEVERIRCNGEDGDKRSFLYKVAS